MVQTENLSYFWQTEQTRPRESEQEYLRRLTADRTSVARIIGDYARAWSADLRGPDVPASQLPVPSLARFSKLAGE